MPTHTEKLGWIGTGRMGYAMAERLAKGGCDIAVWNRTKEKAQPLEKYGAKVVNQLEERSEAAGAASKLARRSLFHDVASVENDHPVRFERGRKPVRDGEDGAAVR